VVLQVFVDPGRLGLTVDAAISMKVPPAGLDAAGRALAAHPAVHHRHAGRAERRQC
jgi:hypothetical protein